MSCHVVTGGTTPGSLLPPITPSLRLTILFLLLLLLLIVVVVVVVVMLAVLHLSLKLVNTFSCCCRRRHSCFRRRHSCCRHSCCRRRHSCCRRRHSCCRSTVPRQWAGVSSTGVSPFFRCDGTPSLSPRYLPIMVSGSLSSFTLLFVATVLAVPRWSFFASL